MLVESPDGTKALLGRSKKHRSGMLTALAGFIDQARGEFAEQPVLLPAGLGSRHIAQARGSAIILVARHHVCKCLLTGAVPPTVCTGGEHRGGCRAGGQGGVGRGGH